MTVIPISERHEPSPAVRSHKIFLEDLCVDADIGFFECEIGTPQRLLVNVEVGVDLAHWPKADTQQDSWDYNFIRDGIKELVAGRRFNLQETLAQEIYAMIAARQGVSTLKVMLRKPDIYPDAKAIGVIVSSE